MSYLAKVSLQRKAARDVEDRNKARKRRASASGIKGAEYQRAQRGEVQPEDGPGWFKRTLALMDPRTWKSKKTIAHEAEVEKKRLEREAADKNKAKASA